MTVTQILPSLYQIAFGSVNAFILDDDGELTLIDTGSSSSAPSILAAIRAIDRQPSDLRQIIVSHSHADHAGSLAELQNATSASVSMHPLDAAMVRQGRARRPWTPAPGLLNRLLYVLFLRNAAETQPPAVIEHELQDGEVLPIAGGIQVIHVPGHSAGQVALLWQRLGGVLFAADSASNIAGLRLSIVYEDLAEGRRSLNKLAQLTFEAACFGHGKAITRGAAARFRQRFGPDASNQLQPSSPLYWLVALPGAAIIGIGARFLLRPDVGAHGFGIEASGTTASAYGRIKGIRDIVSGLLLFAALLRGRRDEITALLSIATLTPLSDMLIVLAHKGRTAYLHAGIHGGTALYMALVTALLRWGSRRR